MKFYTLNELLTDNTPAPKYQKCEGINLYKSLVLITGTSDEENITLAFNFGISLAAGNSFINFIVNESQKVVILCGGGDYHSIRDQIQKMCEGLNFDMNNLIICFDSRIKLNNKEEFKLLYDKLNEIKPDVLIVDPFHHLFEDSNIELDLLFNKLVLLIKEFNLSIILFHNLEKDYNKRITKTSTIYKICDACISIAKTGGNNSNLIKLKYELRHSVPLKSIKLSLNKDSNWFEEISPPVFKLAEVSSQEDPNSAI